MKIIEPTSMNPTVQLQSACVGAHVVAACPISDRRADFSTGGKNDD
jgi:hypothetical protein